MTGRKSAGRAAAAGAGTVPGIGAACGAAFGLLAVLPVGAFPLGPVRPSPPAGSGVTGPLPGAFAANGWR
jgi:hypothetical protein